MKFLRDGRHSSKLHKWVCVVHQLIAHLLLLLSLLLLRLNRFLMGSKTWPALDASSEYADQLNCRSLCTNDRWQRVSTHSMEHIFAYF